MMSMNTTPDGSAGSNNPNNVSYVLSPTTAIKVARFFSSDSIEFASKKKVSLYLYVDHFIEFSLNSVIVPYVDMIKYSLKH